MALISVVMATRNSGRTIETCLRGVRKQKYDQDEIEILAADGGSTDGTQRVVEKYGGVVISERTGSPEAAKALALARARGELVLFLASDNWLPHYDWLSVMVSSLMSEPTAVAAYSWRYAYRRGDNSLNRYFALMGVNDPVAYYLGKPDRQSYLKDEWSLTGRVVKKKKGYWVVEFAEQDMPTLGDNGFLVRRKELMKAGVSPDEFYHIDVCLDLVRQGQNKFVVIKDTVGHNTGKKLIRLVSKRSRYMRELYLAQKQRRRYRWGETRSEQWKLVGYVVKSLTVMEPSWLAVRGMMKRWDWAWWWHPVLSFVMVWVYGWTVLVRQVRRGG